MTVVIILCLFMIQIFREIVVTGFDSSAYETQQIFYSSKDGTKVPMFIVHKKVCLSPSRVWWLTATSGFKKCFLRLVVVFCFIAVLLLCVCMCFCCKCMLCCMYVHV